MRRPLSYIRSECRYVLDYNPVRVDGDQEYMRRQGRSSQCGI